MDVPVMSDFVAGMTISRHSSGRYPRYDPECTSCLEPMLVTSFRQGGTQLPTNSPRTYIRQGKMMNRSDRLSVEVAPDVNCNLFPSGIFPCRLPEHQPLPGLVDCLLESYPTKRCRWVLSRLISGFLIRLFDILGDIFFRFIRRYWLYIGASADTVVESGCCPVFNLV